ncbi:hypothetical protein H257_04419 [Aphanomyces astaci]|uniref:Uncharacterized protein n=1 Tax=Aphanomyces astaci TaxID=112090 RepID=W4GWU1_APHAT|nr:hypothetical protein H257_04419 [Aphanomyces astaci]ETV83801.1 hypothetical protein H257_04419 [Aphanomyces astaci]|eukprot:XP_009827231.1 hypothetical protein H257_04419 [Aphanomyces astaci]
MRWVDAWRHAHIEVIVPRKEEASCPHVTLLEGGNTLIYIRVHTNEPSSILCAGTWFKHRSLVTATCLLYTADKSTTVMRELLTFEPHGESTSSFFLLRSTCSLHVDAAFVDRPLELSVHIQIDGASDSFDQVESSLNYDFLDSVGMPSLVSDVSPASCSPVVHELKFSPSVVLLRPLHISHVLHHDPLDPPTSVVLQLTNVHASHTITVADVFLHSPVPHTGGSNTTSTCSSSIAQEPPIEHFPAVVGPGESFQVVWSVADSYTTTTSSFTASVTWHMTSDSAPQELGDPAMTWHHAIPLPPSDPPGEVSSKAVVRRMSSTSVSARWVASSPALSSGVVSSAHIHVTNHSDVARTGVVLLLPYQPRHHWHNKIELADHDSTASSSTSHMHLLALATQLTAQAPTDFVHVQASYALGTLGGGCTAVVPVEGVPLTLGRLRMEHAVVFDGGNQVFYRQDKAWDVVCDADASVHSVA